ncbi:glutathione S-transferase [Meredithblackwellia eburnea MCA 4105]
MVNEKAKAPDTPPLTPYTGTPNSPILTPATSIRSSQAQGPTPSTSGIDLYQFASPNGLRVTILLEELVAHGYQVEYTEHDMPLDKGRHLESWFTELNPNNRLPVIVDRDVEGAPAIFESPAILLYLCKKYDLDKEFTFEEIGLEAEMISWIFLIHGGLAPSQLEATHFLRTHHRNPIPYAANRYLDETKRLFGVLESRLTGNLKVGGRPQEYLVGDKFSLADIMAFTWVRTAPYTLGVPYLAEAGFPHLERWVGRISSRDATRKALKKDVYASMSSGVGWEEKSRRLVSWLQGEPGIEKR